MDDITPPIVKVSSRIYAFSQRIQGKEPSYLPKSLEIHLSNVCNNSCKFCFYRDDRLAGDRLSFLPTSRIISLLDSFKDESDKSLVLSGGGEPTLHPDFAEIINKAIDVGFDVGVITNGLHYSPKIEQALLKTKWVKFSLHAGNPKAYQELMARNDGAEVFNRVQNHIISLTQAKTANTKVSVGCVITQQNQSDQDILDYFDNATNHLNVDYVLFRGYIGDDPHLKITRPASDFLPVKQQIEIRAKEKGVFSNFSSFIRDYNISRHHTNGKCPIADCGIIAVITTDGNVHICLPSAQQGNAPAIGSILNESFQNIWNGEKHRAVLNSLSMKGCPACKYERMFPLIKKIAHHDCDLLQEQIKAKKDPHWRFL